MVKALNKQVRGGTEGPSFVTREPPNEDEVSPTTAAAKANTREVEADGGLIDEVNSNRRPTATADVCESFFLWWAFAAYPIIVYISIIMFVLYYIIYNNNNNNR